MPRSTADYRWTKPKMLDFLRHLARTGLVSAASRQVGMSRQSAYNLRARLGGEFASLWGRALMLAYTARVAQFGGFPQGDTSSLDCVNQSTSSTCAAATLPTARPIPAPFNRYSARLQ